MRVLWVDADENPWTEASGWRTVEDFGLKVETLPTCGEAHAHVARRDYDLLVVRAELPGAEELLQAARKVLLNDSRRVILSSSTWGKAQFKAHSKTDGAAHRYARVPMPPEGFLGLVADLFGCSVEELADFTLPSDEPLNMDELRGKSAPAAKASFSLGDLNLSAPAEGPAPAPARNSKKRPSAAVESEDVEVLRKYLRIKEEQLNISDDERSELTRENERLQKDAHALQMRLRELEHLEGELTKKIAYMEEDRRNNDFRQRQEKEERDRESRNQAERVKALELQVSDTGEKYENLRVRVRKDIRKIRENERDLEARLELLRRDSETLLRTRDERVLEMQRKIDALEFDLDQVQDSKVQAQVEAERYLAKLSRVARALHVATGIIEHDASSDDELDELEPFMGGAANAEEEKSPSGGGEGFGGDSASGAGGQEMVAEEEAAEDAGLDRELSEDLEALANDGEPTQMLSAEALEDMEGEPESNSG
ncbi:MAG: hypothetical protein EOP11_10455 [Proteobacteria bacterium]|nr:MAG: hypothetical protein EOP11_10455 [Pseudomonadota bacterium]